jgi:glycosyltransferase involved in cell wall biosynthesis
MEVLSLPGNHWRWRMREAALYFASHHRKALLSRNDLLLASSYLPLAELYGLVPELVGVPSVLYFHENQLAYPPRDGRTDQRDLHFGFTQAVSAAAATKCVFNSRYNLRTFLDHLAELLGRMPSPKPGRLVETIEEKSVVLGVPIDLTEAPTSGRHCPFRRSEGPIILWSHRWEHDKNPEAFFAALNQLDQRKVAFRLIVCGGHRTAATPQIFEEARRRFASHLLHWGFVEDRKQYLRLAASSHIAVSTADHEFFGISMLEATGMGAYPLVPDRLAYPEIFPPAHRYSTDTDLVERLEALCKGWAGGTELRPARRDIVRPFLAANLAPRYHALFSELAAP